MSDSDPKLPFVPQGHLEPGAEREEFEPDGTSPRGLGCFIIGLFVFIGLGLVVAALVFPLARGRVNSAARYDVPMPPQAGPAAVWVAEPKAYQGWLADETAHLDRYQWIDRDHGVVQLPMSRAMELLLAGASASQNAASQPGSQPASRPAGGTAP